MTTVAAGVATEIGVPVLSTATGIGGLAWLLIALPAAGALVLFVGGRRTDRWGHLLGVATVLVAFVVALLIFFDFLGKPPEARISELSLFTWFQVDALQVDFGLRLDPLSLAFVLLITGVGGLIHIYAVGYMAADPGRRRFFAQFNLFVTAMLILVLANNFVMLYLGWEGVGLASYLLIGWYHQRPAAASAAKKAFLFNRVGDVGLALAIFILFTQLGTVQYTDVFARVGEIDGGALLAIALLLLLAATGKSGQFPLQAWLPDAMEGPTPVSALIHAATMVTAGVYLIARCNPLYNLTADGRLAVAAIGAFTLLLGAIIGCSYDDIKKVLAYSTVSQIGYMFLAVGLGPEGYALGLFLLFVHGFFKATLFLGAGSVMHAMHDEVDMRRMGGLRKTMPITFWTFTAGYLAIIGFPFLDGYFAKDPIIEAAFARPGAQGWILGSAALIGAGLTAFYMTRLWLMTFFGEERWKSLSTEDGATYHPHESPAVMTVPMIVLGIGSLVAGGLLAWNDAIEHWLEPTIGPLEEVANPVPSTNTVLVLILVFAAAGVLIAYLVIGRRPVPVTRPQDVSWPVRAARADLYGNALNEALIARPGTWLARALVFLDNKGIDGLVNGTAALLGGSSGRLRRLQTGFVRSYALSMLGGGVLVIAALLALRLIGQ